MGCININILLGTSYYNFAKCYHWGELGKTYMESLNIISYNCS